MNLIKSIQPLLTIIGIDTGQETAVTVTRPTLPAWQPHGQQIERVIRRVRQDGNVTIFEEEVVYLQRAPVAAQNDVIFITAPDPAARPVAVREPSSGGPTIVDCDGNPARPELVAKYYAGGYEVVNAAPHIPRQRWER